jgi:hypothetical protein
LVGLLIFARLPHRGFPTNAYRPQFSDDRFGVWVTAEPSRAGEAKETLVSAGALEVQDIEPQTREEARV